MKRLNAIRARWGLLGLGDEALDTFYNRHAKARLDCALSAKTDVAWLLRVAEAAESMAHAFAAVSAEDDIAERLPCYSQGICAAEACDRVRALLDEEDGE